VSLLDWYRAAVGQRWPWVLLIGLVRRFISRLADSIYMRIFHG